MLHLALLARPEPRNRPGITVGDVARPRPAARPGTEGDGHPSAAEAEQRLRDHRTTPLSDLGEDPDPRFTFANERTFLAWSRTALALIAAGLAAAQLLHFGFGGVRLIIALPLIALGAAAAVNSYRQWESNERRLRLRLPLSYSPVGKLVAVGISVIGVAAGILVLVDLIAK
jgi:putative membrane protein